jgi:Fe-S-cluster containining protein
LSNLNFSCTICGKCCHNTKIPLSVAESIEWLSAGLRVQIICEAASWFEPARADDPKRARFERRSFAARCGSIRARVVALLVADVPNGCPNLLADLRCGIYERRPMVCRIYPAEINPFVKLMPETKRCPPEAWAAEHPPLQRDGEVISQATKRSIQQWRDADERDVAMKARLCAALKIAEAAVAEEGFLIHSPSISDLMAALALAKKGEDLEPAAEQWRLVSDRVDTVSELVGRGALVVHSRELNAASYQYFTVGA